MLKNKREKILKSLQKKIKGNRYFKYLKNNTEKGQTNG